LRDQDLDGRIILKSVVEVMCGYVSDIMCLRMGPCSYWLRMLSFSLRRSVQKLLLWPERVQCATATMQQF